MQNCIWESMYTVIPGSLDYNQATIAIRTRATNELSQNAANTFSVVYTRKLPEWDPKRRQWSEPKPTRKFAAAVSQVLRAEWGGNRPDRSIDLDNLWGVIQPILDAKDWTFDGYFDGAYNIWSLVMEMCQPFRVVPRISNGGVDFVYDRPGRPIRHVFTPRDIIRGSVSIIYNTFTDATPDNIIWNYLDEDAGHQQREVQCALPDSQTKNPVIKSFIGVAKRKQAFEMGVYACACNRHRRVQVKFRVEAIGRLILMGDVCALTHPYFSNVANGAVRNWDAGEAWIDLGGEPIGLAEGVDHYLGLARRDGYPWGPCKIAKIEGQTAWLDQDDLALLRVQGQQDPFEYLWGEGAPQPTPWTIQSSREFAGRLIVQSVVQVDSYNNYEITAVNE